MSIAPSAPSKAQTKEVEDWWNNNPFSFGFANERNDQVGTIALDSMDLAYFDAIDQKFRKHSREVGGVGGSQKDGAPLFSKLIDYPTQVAGKRVLDIAVGSGFSLVEFAKHGARSVVGIDLTEFSVAHASKNLELRSLPGLVKKMDAQKMSFDGASFDFVNAWGCLMHMPDTEGAIREMYRVLAPGGSALAYMYNKRSWPYWFNIIFVRGILMLGLIRYRFDTVKLTSRYSDGYSVGGNMLTKFYTPKEAALLFEKAGFTNVRSVPFVLVDAVDTWPMRRIPFFKYLPFGIKKWLASFSYALIVTAKKA